MAQYIFIKDFKSETFNSSNPSQPIIRNWQKGTVIEGRLLKVAGKQSVLLTTPDGKLPIEGIIGGISVSIPFSVIEIIATNSPQSTSSVFSTKNVIIGAIGIAVAYFGAKHFKLF